MDIILLYYHQGIYNCISKTNHVSRVYSVAALLYLQFVIYVMLFRMCTFTLTLSEMHVQCLTWLFFVVPLLLLLLLVVVVVVVVVVVIVVVYYVVHCMKFHVDIFPTKYMKY